MLAGKWILSAILLAGALTCALAGQPTTSPQGKSGDEEEKILQAAKVPTDNDSLLAYLKTRTLTDERRAEIDHVEGTKGDHLRHISQAGRGKAIGPGGQLASDQFIGQLGAVMSSTPRMRPSRMKDSMVIPPVPVAWNTSTS